MSSLRLFGICTAWLAWASAVAWAADPRTEARACFDRGMALLDKHSDAAALAEFQRAYDLVPERQTLMMIGVLYGVLDRPVQGVEALDRLLGDPGALTAAQLDVARNKREEQARRVARVRVSTNVPASIQVDGLDIGQTPSSAGFAVAAGARIVGAFASGYIPVRKEVVVAGGVTSDVALVLLPSELKLAHLVVHTGLPDADLLVDGQIVARTPLVGSITLQPGQRLVELRRAGYQTASSRVTLGDGATADLSLAPAESPADGGRGTLAVEASEREVNVAIDGIGLGAYQTPLALVSGHHLVTVSRAGFLASERLVYIPENDRTTIHATLTPTAETRAAFVDHARSVRRWGWATALSGAALAIGAGAFVVATAPQSAKARRDRDNLYATFSPGGDCDRMHPKGDFVDCQTALNAANDDVAARTTRTNVALVVGGEGLAAAGVGAYILLTADDPHRYDVVDHGAQREPSLGFTATVGGRNAILTLTGAF
jgi:hypothetical protein